MKGKLVISPGNMKLGKIPNISLAPGRSCGNHSFCLKTCYAVKAMRAYPTVRRAWSHNSRIFEAADRSGDWGDIELQLGQYLTKRKPRFFRWHVAGDFISQAHVKLAIRLAHVFPYTKFLAFTKMDTLDFRGCPPNLTVIASMWPGMPDRFPDTMMRAWMDDGNETRMPATVLECPGGCDTCGMCWSLNQIGRDIRFHKH